MMTSSSNNLSTCPKLRNSTDNPVGAFHGASIVGGIFTLKFAMLCLTALQVKKRNRINGLRGFLPFGRLRCEKHRIVALKIRVVRRVFFNHVQEHHEC